MIISLNSSSDERYKHKLSCVAHYLLCKLNKNPNRYNYGNCIIIIVSNSPCSSGAVSIIGRAMQSIPMLNLGKTYSISFSLYSKTIIIQ